MEHQTITVFTTMKIWIWKKNTDNLYKSFSLSVEQSVRYKCWWVFCDGPAKTNLVTLLTIKGYKLPRLASLVNKNLCAMVANLVSQTPKLHLT